MGIKSTDLVTLGSYGPTAQTPYGRELKVKIAQVTRTDTTSPVKMVLPAHCSIVEMRLVVTTASDAGTTATVTLVANGTTVINAANVKATGVTSSTIIQLEDVPQSGDIKITGNYAETGTASTTGGPFYFYVFYVE